MLRASQEVREYHLDDALVTAQGCELMTRGVPVKAGEIEALMRG